MKEKENITKKQSFIRIIGKCFIWLLISFLITFFISLLKAQDILLGFLPTTLCYIVSLYLCKKSGEIWDDYYYKKLEKKTKKFEMKNDTEMASENVTEIAEEISNNTLYTSPQKNNIETTQTESTMPLSYKERKKVARKIYREQKLLLKETRKKPAPRNFKIITIVLCVILCFSLIANILLAVHISDLNEELQSQKYYAELYKNKYNDSLIDFNNLEEEYDNYKSKAIKDFSKAYFLDNKLAFIDANDSYHYHTYDCEEFQNADSYYVHNIEYAESQGYRGHSCVIIRRNSK